MSDDIKRDNLSGFVNQVQHLIDEYSDCEITTAEMVGAIELIKHDLLLEISGIILPDDGRNNIEDN